MSEYPDNYPPSACEDIDLLDERVAELEQEIKLMQMVRPSQQEIDDMETELSECLRVHAEYSNRMEAALKESERVSKSWKVQWKAALQEAERIKKLLYEREEGLGKRRCQHSACHIYRVPDYD